MHVHEYGLFDCTQSHAIMYLNNTLIRASILYIPTKCNTIKDKHYMIQYGANANPHGAVMNNP